MWGCQADECLLLWCYIVTRCIMQGGVIKMVRKLELMKSSSEPLLLCLIGQQPMYGYQILKELDRRSDGYFKFKEGTLYPALHRLEKAGLVVGEWQILPSGRRRRYYNITGKGRQLLVTQRSQWQDVLTAMNLIIQPART